MRKRIPSFDLLVLICLVARVSASNVTWLSPAAGDVYASGDTIVGQWKAADGSFTSPSFSLCTFNYDEGGREDVGTQACGSHVWPTISQNDEMYLIYLCLPNVTSSEDFHLQMENGSGQTADSPPFTLNPTASDAHNATSPMRDSSPSPATASPSPSSSKGSSSSIQPLPNFAETTAPVPTAAYVVPLSLVLSVLLAAGALAVHHRRKLSEERKKDERALLNAALSRNPSLDADIFGTGRFTRLPYRGCARSAASAASETMSVCSRAPSVAGSAVGHADDAWSMRSAKRDASDDGVSLYSVATLTRQPVVRRATREPFFRGAQGHGRRRPARVTAGAFRAGVSPVPPTLAQFDRTRYDDDDDCGERDSVYRAKRQSRRRRCEMDRASDASVEESVVSRYVLPSPVLPSSPEKLHVRRCAGEGGFGGAGSWRDKRLPASPVALYEEVARRVSGQELARRRVSGRR
ncbi:hypothetical protein WOLCODRAFT_147329 [Wolfiporia cocos MD-104 SS10]|uniref:Uncharacterized protein n=1 Tax=Wolfiporia cocos (strain MD-104) TaxID=742152 RepID=A0A2H3J6E2_WOLCO|nr:hypothetical protein WOLCODRAFT_147329 [Wolfiporia cocos MD-104 SS10]